MASTNKKPVSGLEGAELDYWVARAEELPNINKHPNGLWYSHNKDLSGYGELPMYSTDWAQAGPIIIGAGICLLFTDNEARVFIPNTDGILFSGPKELTLVFAMRCFVASKFGDYVKVIDHDN